MQTPPVTICVVEQIEIQPNSSFETSAPATYPITLLYWKPHKSHFKMPLKEQRKGRSLRDYT